MDHEELIQSDNFPAQRYMYVPEENPNYCVFVVPFNNDVSVIRTADGSAFTGEGQAAYKVESLYEPPVAVLNLFARVRDRFVKWREGNIESMILKDKTVAVHSYLKTVNNT